MHHVHFVFCLHNHQPEGNFDQVFADATARAYRPFLEALPRHPSIKVCLHYSGMLFNWFNREAPDLLNLIQAGVASGQVELLGGGFHEPILSVIPDQDKQGQLRKMADYLIEEFDVIPRGMWLAERIWEQHLVAPIVRAGHDYTVLDDTHFLSAGLTNEDLDGYYATEENGLSLSLFPISRELRYAIPFAPVSKVIEVLRKYAEHRDGAVAVYADDGEKFGVWPRTEDLVWTRGWLEQLFEALERESDWLHTAHFSEIRDSMPPKGRIYLPDASYEEMAEWSLIGTRAAREYETLRESLLSRPDNAHLARFVRGGFWRNFLVKYPESNTMHKKMLRLSRRVQAEVTRLPSTVLDVARHHLYAAQCNCPYWHGVFGGVYLPHLRGEVYRNLLLAEAVLDGASPRSNNMVDSTDFDGDGHKEVLIETFRQNIYLSPADGGKVFLWEWKPAAMNLLDVLSRREEGYHSRIEAATSDQGGERSIHDSWTAKEADLASQVVLDWYRKGSFIDHLLEAKAQPHDLASMQFRELGDFVNQPWDEEIFLEQDSCRIVLTRLGNLWIDGQASPLEIRKIFQVNRDDDILLANYEVINHGTSPQRLRFAVEWNYALLSGSSPDRYFWFDTGQDPSPSPLAGQCGEVHSVNHFGVCNEWDNVVASLRVSLPATVWYSPIHTVALSENGFEKTYQGSTLLAIWEIEVEKSWSVDIQHEWSVHH